MKILQINAVYKTGSTGRNIYEMNEVFKRKGIKSYIAATHIDNTSINDCYQIGNKIDWINHAIMSRIFGIQGYFSKKATKKFLRYIKEINPDIIHLNNVHANYLNLPTIFKFFSENNIAVVITLHDCWFYTGKCTHYTLAQCSKWQTGCCNCPRKKVDNKSWFFDRTNKMWNDKKEWYESISNLAVVGVSNWITEEAKKSILKSANTIRKIYNWVDLDVFRPKTEKIEKFEDKFVILGVASIWNEKKGLDTFIELSSYLKDDEIVILIGELPQIDLPRNILHIATINDIHELALFYSSSDVFLQLSMEESFGKVVAESLSCGTPVITINSTANKELVPEKCGIVIDEPDLDTIYDAITYIKNKKKNTYSEHCRQFAMENFDMNKRIDDYISLYKEILND